MRTTAALKRFSDALGVLGGASGVYVIMNQRGLPLWVGMSLDVSWRLYCHAGNGEGLYTHVLEGRGVARTAEAVLAVHREILGTYLVGFIPVSAADGLRAFRKSALGVEGTLQAILSPVYGRRELPAKKEKAEARSR